MYLAFKKTSRPTLFGPVSHKIGALLDHSPYSHVEIVFSDGISASSVIGHGVRFKRIDYTPGAWDFYSLPPELESFARQWFIDHEGEPYDNLGVLRFGMNIFYQSENAWFCSEAIGAALGISESWRYGPGGLRIRCVDQFKSEILSSHR